jgi:hypothetical protein
VKQTEYKSFIVPPDKTVQVAPPSVVFITTPLPPTAYPILEVGNITEFNELPCGKGFCQVH